MRYTGEARRALWASQVAPGNENALMLCVYGTKGGFVWRQETPNQLFGSPSRSQHRSRGGPSSGEAAVRATRLPLGHSQGYLEGSANIYSEIAAAMKPRTAAGSRRRASTSRPSTTKSKGSPYRGGVQFIATERKVGETRYSLIGLHLDQTTSALGALLSYRSERQGHVWTAPLRQGLVEALRTYRVRSCLRPVDAGNECPAGPDAGPHGSSPNQQNALVMAPALFLGLPSRSVGSHRFAVALDADRLAAKPRSC